MLEIKDLHVVHEGKEILKGIDLTIKAGEIHALMGPNGAGKSTLVKVLAGHSAYEVVQGSVTFMDSDLLDLDPEERAHLGLFLSFQYPPEIMGVSTFQFLFHAYNAKQKAKGEKVMSEEEFHPFFDEKLALVEMRDEFKERSVNSGFSGGEKKKNEILQMALLEPTLSLLDETDSGLDIDAMRIVASGVNRLMTKKKSLLLITHYRRLLDLIVPAHIHVLVGGKIVLSGGRDLVQTLEERGYDWLGE